MVLTPEPQHPPKVKYFLITIKILISTLTHPPKVKYQCQANLQMAIVHRSMHDAIHAVREQHRRAVTRSLLTQQRTLAANKLQRNTQIKRTSTPDPPSMSNVPPR